MTIYGAYAHLRPDGRVFYVGKGSVNRSRSMTRNSYHDRIVAKYGAGNIIVRFAPCESEDAAFELEEFIIEVLAAEGVAISNMTDGGEGISGYSHTDATKQIMSATRKGRKRSPEAIAKTAAGKRGTKLSDEVKAKISAAHIGKKISPESIAKSAASRTGLKRSPAAVEKTAAANRGMKRTPETCANISAAGRGRKQTQEHIAKMVASKIGKSLTPEHRANISAGNKGKVRTAEHTAKIVASTRANRIKKQIIEGDKNDL